MQAEKVADEGIGLVERSTLPTRMPSYSTSSLSSLTSSQPSKDDEAAMNKILDNRETREALGDPEIQNLMSSLKFNIILMLHKCKFISKFSDLLFRYSCRFKSMKFKTFLRLF